MIPVTTIRERTGLCPAPLESGAIHRSLANEQWTTEHLTLLYPLGGSDIRVNCRHFVPPVGLEPTTHGLKDRCSNQLSHRGMRKGAIVKNAPYYLVSLIELRTMSYNALIN